MRIQNPYLPEFIPSVGKFPLSSVSYAYGRGVHVFIISSQLRSRSLCLNLIIYLSENKTEKYSGKIR